MEDRKEACVAFLHPVFYQKEWDDFNRELVPSHRLWGQVEMERLGWAPLLCPRGKGFFSRDAGWRWLVWQGFWLWRRRHEVHAVFAVHEVSALFALVLRAVGLLRMPLVVLNFGLLHPKNTRGMRRLLWKGALRYAASVVSLVEGQIPEVQKYFGIPRERQSYVPLGVDGEFLRSRCAQPAETTGARQKYTLAVGTNEGKDYGTLLEALPLGVRLVIVTDRHNAALIRAHRCYGADVEVLEGIPMQKLRELYHDASLVVIPLHDTPYGSGHTVFLENLALGKTLIVSSSRGMQGYARPGVNCLTVKVGDTRQLREAIQAVMKDPGCFENLQRAALKDAAENFSVGKFAAGISRVLAAALGAEGGAPGSGGCEKGAAEKGGKHASV